MSQLKTIEQINLEINKYSPHPERVKLLAVSKLQPVDKIKDLVNQDQNRFVHGTH